MVFYTFLYFCKRLPKGLSVSTPTLGPEWLTDTLVYVLLRFVNDILMIHEMIYRRDVKLIFTEGHILVVSLKGPVVTVRIN